MSNIEKSLTVKNMYHDTIGLDSWSDGDLCVFVNGETAYIPLNALDEVITFLLEHKNKFKSKEEN